MGYGGAWDSKGNLAVTNWPNNTTDFFTAKTIQGNPAGAKADKTLTLTQITELFFEAADKPKKDSIRPCCGAAPIFADDLIADGFDANGNFIVEEVNVDTGAETLLQTIGNATSGTGFPGGLAVDNKSNLTVDNQFGYLYTFGPPWTGLPKYTFAYDFPANDFTTIALDSENRNLYAANIFYEGSTPETDIQQVSYPIGSLGAATLATADEEYQGAATIAPSKE
jgi:hypothetical protein